MALASLIDIPIPQSASTTIQASKKAQWTVIVGTALSYLVAHIGDALAFVPPEYAGVASSVVQLGTAIGVVIHSKQAIQGRINATQKVAP